MLRQNQSLKYKIRLEKHFLSIYQDLIKTKNQSSTINNFLLDTFSRNYMKSRIL